MKIKHSLRWLPASGLCLLAGCQSAPPPSAKVQISRVMSGQSVEWVDRSQQPPVILQGRLAGIDAPDLAQEPWGKQAKQRLEALTGKEGVGVEFDSSEADKYGRKFIYLWKDDRSINEQLLKEGYVLASIRTPTAATVNSGTKYRDRFFRASQYARLMGVGIWNPDLPMRMSPAEFRKEER
jgi:micrococcal nuclease